MLCGVKDWMNVAIPAVLAGRESEKKGIAPRRIVGYGWPKGWPERNEKDLGPGYFKEGENPLNEEQILHYIKETGILKRYTSLKIKLLDENLISEYSGEIGGLFSDANLFEPTRDALKNLWPKVVEGGLLILNNHKEYPSKLRELGNSAYDKSWYLYIGPSGEPL